MKRVLIFSLSYLPHIGGAEIALKEITDRISPAEFEFHLMTKRFGDEKAEEKIGNIIVHRVGSGASRLSKARFIGQAVREAERLHTGQPFDLFWAVLSYMVVPIMRLQKHGISVPYVLSLQDGDTYGHVFNRLAVMPFRSLLRKGFEQASGIQAISSFLATWAKRQGYQQEVAVIPNGVDWEHFTHVYPNAEVAATRARLVGAAKVKTLLVTVSRLVHKNAVDDIICALAKLDPSVHLAVCGTGPDEKMLRALAEKERVGTRVYFLGYVSHEALPLVLRSCDMFIRPSRSEGMGNAFIEAMAAGIPVVGTHEGGIPDFLYDDPPPREATGFIVARDDPQDIARQVSYVLGHPEEARERSAAARELVRQKYDWNDIAQRMRAFLNGAQSVDKRR